MTATLSPPARSSRPLQLMNDAVRAEVERLSLDGDLADIRQADLPDEDFIHYLRNMMTPVRLSIKWPGKQRALNTQTKELAASTVNIDADVAKFSTLLYDMTTDKWKRIQSLRSQATLLWRRKSIDYPAEKGVRLMRRELVDTFRSEMDVIRDEVRDAAVALNERFPELLEEGRLRRGDAYRREDYPENLLDSFAITYSFPSVECSADLRSQNPQLWLDECRKVRENLEESLHRAESEYLGQLDEVIGFLVEKLQPNPDGGKKTMRETALTNIADIIETFKQTNLGGRPSVLALSDRLERVTGSTSIELLRKSEATRAAIQAKLQTVRAEVLRLKVEEEREHLQRKSTRHLRLSNPRGAS